MSKRKKRILIIVMIFAVTFLVIGASVMVHWVNIYNFNHTEHIYKPGQNEDLKFEFAARGGVGDTWDKLIYDNEHPDGALYQALIYDATITNLTKYNITDWQWKINFSQPCYINNGWCGTFEFHQKDMTQELDLRSYNVAEICLNHVMADTELMITMNPGEYMIYKPSMLVWERPIGASDISMGKYRSVTMGFIIYFDKEIEVSLDDYEIIYYLETDFWKEGSSWWYLGALILWLAALVVFVVVEIFITIAYRRLRREEKLIRQSLDVFTTFFDAKDPYTNGHSKRVAGYAAKIAEKLKFSEYECNKVFYAALMHDCGKCYIPDSILKKPGKLTPEEFDTIRSHTTKGAEMLKDFDAVENIREGALYHHERYDGLGYPSGKKGEEIPLIARIICVADAFDAMNSSRCYRGKLSKEKIISELKENKGKQFDPHIADCMLELIDDGVIQVAPEENQ